jgi:hypothetical protein
MLSIRDYPSSFFKNFPPNPGTKEYFELHVDDNIDTIAKDKQQVANQVKPVSNGLYGFIHPVNYPDIITGQSIKNFQPFFPNKDLIGSQVKAVTYDAQLIPHSVPYPDITTGTPVGKFNFVNNPPPVGKNLNISV